MFKNNIRSKIYNRDFRYVENPLLLLYIDDERKKFYDLCKPEMGSPMKISDKINLKPFRRNTNNK